MPEGRRKHIIRDSSELDPEQGYEIRLKRAREQLSILREQEERLDRERVELESLKTQTEELEADKREINAKLANAVAILEEEEEETKKRQQEVVDARKEFETLIKEMHLAEKQSQRAENIPGKIAVEREIVGKAREAFQRAGEKLDVLGEEEIGKEEDELEYTREVFGLVEGLKVGLGFFLAGAVLSTIVYILFLIFRQ